jgi:hypothetical protein
MIAAGTSTPPQITSTSAYEIASALAVCLEKADTVSETMARNSAASTSTAYAKASFWKFTSPR